MFKVYTDLANEEYHAEKDHLSSSNYKMLLKDIERFYKEKIKGLRESVQKNAFDEGSLAHGLILEPHLVDEEFAMFEGFQKRGKAFEAFKKDNQGKTILSKSQWKKVERWVENYKKLPVAVELTDKCEKEVSLFGHYMGIKSKVRADGINPEEGYILDLKTSGYDTDIDTFKSVIMDFGYDISAALYTEMFEAYYKKPFDFYFVVLGKKDNACNVYKLSEESKQRGKEQLFKAVRTYKKCKRTGIWKNERRKLEVQNVTDYEILEV